jgi:hypothetical protein
VADVAIELLGAPNACDQTTEYDNRIEDEVEVEPDDEEEREDADPRRNWGDIEQQFARYERNYRARRIRELTLAPVKKKRGARRSGNAVTVAAI